MVLDTDNILTMRESGRVIWLQASPETIRRRLARDARSADIHPPLTSVGDAYTEINQTLARRMPLYRHAVDFVMATDDLSADEVWRAVAGRWAEDLTPKSRPPCDWG